MKGDFSRNTFNPSKHYNSVLKQQGRVDVDADWNEQQAINLRRIETEATDVIGSCGAPLHNAGFEITVDSNNVLRIGAGRYYVDGILCENETIGLDYLAQPDCLNLSPVAEALKRSKTNLGIIFLDVWQRHITALDDSLIREKALGGPDTASRLKTLWQVKLLPVSEPDAATSPSCDTAFSAWNDLIAPGTGTLNARTQPPSPAEQACLLPPSAGYQRLENQLYRVEIHKINADGTPFFVWSRDNGTVVSAIVSSVSGKNVVVADVGPDDVLGFASGQWVEIVDDETELSGSPGSPAQLLQIENVDEATRTITMKTVPQAVDMNAHPKLRRWDQGGDSATQDGVAATFDRQPIEDGIEVQFSRADGKTLLTYKPGDYWLIPARTATGEIEWPPFAIPNTSPIAQLPAGIRHHYCRLALAQIVGGAIKIQDCRRIFPPLTELSADQCCAITLSPGKDWKAALARLRASSSVHICFQVGDYSTDEPIRLGNFKSLKITGSGPGTRILAPKSEAAFIISGCQSVEVSGLFGSTGVTGFGKTSELKSLTGVLTFYGCGSISIDRVALKGADWMASAGATRAASCICIEPGPAPVAMPTTSVRIHHCDLTVGFFQVGMLIVDAQRTHIEDNTIAVQPAATKLTLGRLLENRQIRANIRRLLVSRPIVQATPKPGSKPPLKATTKLKASSRIDQETKAANLAILATGRVTFVAGKTTLVFDTSHELKKTLPALLTADLAKASATEALPVRLNRIADKILLDPKFRQKNQTLSTWFKDLATEVQSSSTPASQGIVVAGSSANEVRILDNSIAGVAQGIHVGLSHRGVPRSTGFDIAASVFIRGNSVQVNSSALLRAHEGIFVGNCDNLIIEANRLIVAQQLERRFASIDGIRLFGWLPSLVIVRHNRITGFGRPGITVKPLGQGPKLQLPPSAQLASENLVD